MSYIYQKSYWPYIDLFRKYKSDCSIFFETGTHCGESVSDALELGFEKIIISGFNTKGIDTKKHSIEIIPVERVDEAYRLFF